MSTRLSIGVKSGLVATAIVCTACGGGSGNAGHGQPITHAFVSTDGTSITASFAGSPCYTAKLSAKESPQVVTLTLKVSAPAGKCIELAAEGQADITLHSPLGNRSLRDSATGHLIPHNAVSN